MATTKKNKAYIFDIQYTRIILYRLQFFLIPNQYVRFVCQFILKTKEIDC